MKIAYFDTNDHRHHRQHQYQQEPREKNVQTDRQEWQVIQIVHWVCLFPSMIKARIAVIRNINWKIRSQKWIIIGGWKVKGDGARIIGFYLFVCTSTSIFHRRIWVIMNWIVIRFTFYLFRLLFKSFTRKGYFHSLFFWGLLERKSNFFRPMPKTFNTNFSHFDSDVEKWLVLIITYPIPHLPHHTHALSRSLRFQMWYRHC